MGAPGQKPAKAAHGKERTAPRHSGPSGCPAIDRRQRTLCRQAKVSQDALPRQRPSESGSRKRSGVRARLCLACRLSAPPRGTSRLTRRLRVCTTQDGRGWSVGRALPGIGSVSALLPGSARPPTDVPVFPLPAEARSVGGGLLHSLRLSASSASLREPRRRLPNRRGGQNQPADAGRSLLHSRLAPPLTGTARRWGRTAGSGAGSAAGTWSGTAGHSPRRRTRAGSRSSRRTRTAARGRSRTG